jgi:fructose 1,6-bisphosphatase
MRDGLMQTLSIIKADTGGFVGHTAVHPRMIELARERVETVRGDLLLDGQGCHLRRRPVAGVEPRRSPAGPFEPHRLPLEEMEYTTMPQVAARLADRWEPIAKPAPAIA